MTVEDTHNLLYSTQDTIWFAILLIPVLVTIFIALITGNISELTFIGCMGWFFFVLALWWADTKKSPIKLCCPNCGAVTEGTLGTYLVRFHWFSKVYMECPKCGKEAWLEGKGRFQEKRKK